MLTSSSIILLLSQSVPNAVDRLTEQDLLKLLLRFTCVIEQKNNLQFKINLEQTYKGKSRSDNVQLWLNICQQWCTSIEENYAIQEVLYHIYFLKLGLLPDTCRSHTKLNLPLFKMYNFVLYLLIQGFMRYRRPGMANFFTF